MDLLRELIDVRERRMLREAVDEYLSTVLAHLKARDACDVFNTDNPLVDIDQLASIVSGMKVLSDHEIRSSLTVDDVRINPNSSIQVFNILNSVPRTGRGTPKLTLDVFKSLSQVAPKHFAEERVRLKALKSKDKSERDKAVADLEAVAAKATKMFHRVREIAHGGEEV